MMRAVTVTLVALTMLAASCGEPERVCLRQTCEERYYTTLVLIGKVWMPQRRVRTECECHEYYVPGEPR